MNARFGWLILALTVLCGCAEKKAETKRYALHGEVLRLDAQGHIAAIKHEQIGDWMGPMTMEFPVPSAQEFSALREGERINATVFVEGFNYWVGEIREDRGQGSGVSGRK